MQDDLALDFSWIHVPPLLAALVAGVFGVVVLTTDPRRPVNRRLALVLFLEMLYAGAVFVLFAFKGEEPRFVEVVGFASVGALAVAYLQFLSLLDTPLASMFRRRPVVVGLWLFVVALAVSGYLFGTPATGSEENIMVQVNGMVLSLIVIVGGGILSVAITVSAFRRTAPGSSARTRAKAILIAFVTRDAIWILSVVGAVGFAVAGQVAISDFFWNDGIPVAILAYVPILSYGILKTQLFDLDLRIKWGATRGAVIGFVVIIAFASAKIVEAYVNQNVGYVFGGIIAGLVLFFGPRLNKVAEKVADKAAPNVAPTNEYLAYRKLEVFRAAYESAVEAGGIDKKERDILDRLRIKLGLRSEDTNALENELRVTADSSSLTGATSG